MPFGLWFFEIREFVNEILTTDIVTIFCRVEMNVLTVSWRIEVIGV